MKCKTSITQRKEAVMDPKDLEELKKLKEQKYADLEKLQELAKMSIPDFDAAEQASPDEATGETI